MIISHKHKFIFIHIPRTGGTSISKSLCRSMGIENWQAFIGEPKSVVSKNKNLSIYDDLTLRNLTGWKHAKAQKVRQKVGDEVWNSYFKFSFIRNPWDRALSMYLKMRKDSFLKPIWPKSRRLFNFLIKIKYSFFKLKSHQQIDFITDNKGKILVDFLGRFENLEKDFYEVCKIIGLESKLEYHNDRTQHLYYRKIYNKTSKDIMRRVKREDIQKFDYSF